MADLIQSLITSHSSQSSQPQPLHPTSSNESFHSTGSQQPHPLSTSASKAHPQLPPPTLKNSKGNLPIFDINAYLTDPANAALLASTNASSSSSSKRKASHSNNDNPQDSPPTTSTTSSSSIPLGTSTSHHVSLLNTLCQTKGLPTPIYEIAPTNNALDHSIRFGGCVRVGTETVRSEQQEGWRNKKEAREGLAERAIPLATAMTGRVKQQHPSGAGTTTTITTTTTTTTQQSHDSGIGAKNWVGVLQEYHSAMYSGSQSPLYSYYQVEGRYFAATCAIPAALPGQQFGSPTAAFASKKAAQGNAAREAVEALMAEGKIGADGATTAGGRKKSKGSGSGDGGGGGGGGRPCVRLTEAGLVVSKSGSFAQRVNDMAPLMGLPAPQYHVEPATAAAPNLLNGYATFNGVPALQGPVGEARNVYGKRNAREEVAKGVWEVLRALAESRGFEPKEI